MLRFVRHDRAMASIAHLSDPHVTTGPAAAEPAARLRRVLDRVLALDPRPDCVVVTGDLVEHGRPREYEALAAILDGHPLPLHLAPGNHDDPAVLATVLGPAPPVAEYPFATVITLDSHVPGKPAGLLGAQQLARLDAALAEHPGKPAFVAVHHPPIAVAVPLLDGMRLDDGPALAEVVARHPRVARVLSGHVHRAITAPFAGTLLAVAPSTYRQTVLGGPDGPSDEPPGFLLHTEAEGAWITHAVAVPG